MEEKNVFQNLGSDESAVCGPEGCNIQAHRDKEKNQDKKSEVIKMTLLEKSQQGHFVI